MSSSSLTPPGLQDSCLCPPVPQAYLSVQPCPAGEEHVFAEPRGAAAAALARGGVQHLQLRAPRHPVHAEAGGFPGLPSASLAHPCTRETPVSSSAHSEAAPVVVAQERSSVNRWHRALHDVTTG